MKKLKYLIPVIILFICPWMHWALFHNLIAANVDISIENAHALVWFSQAGVGIFTLIWMLNS